MISGNPIPPHKRRHQVKTTPFDPAKYVDRMLDRYTKSPDLPEETQKEVHHKHNWKVWLSAWLYLAGSIAFAWLLFNMG